MKKVLDLLQTSRENFKERDESEDNRLRLFTDCVQPDGDSWRLSVVRALDEELVNIMINRLKPTNMTLEEWYKLDMVRGDMPDDLWYRRHAEYKETHNRYGYRVLLLWGNAGREYKKSTAFLWGPSLGRPCYVVQGQEEELIVSDNLQPRGDTKGILAEEVLILLNKGTLMCPRAEEDVTDAAT